MAANKKSINVMMKNNGCQHEEHKYNDEKQFECGPFTKDTWTYDVCNSLVCKAFTSQGRPLVGAQ